MKIFSKVKYDNGVTYYYFLDRNIGRMVDNCYYFFNERYIGWHDWKFEIVYNTCGYESCSGEIHLSIFGWHNVFKTPFRSRRFPYGDCDSPTYGISVFNNTFWIYTGGNGNLGGGRRLLTWDLPFFTKKHVRHDVMCNIGDDDNVDLRLISMKLLSGEKNDYKPLTENSLVYKYHYDFTDSYDSSIVPCTFWVEEREWRPKWLTWTDMFKYVKRYIEIEFDGEVGEDKDDWKGGCVGCSYNLLPGESPMECIMRMEKNKKF